MLCGCDRKAEVGLFPGDVAPDIELTDMDGKVVRLSDYRGKFVLLSFWASWCQPCIVEMPSLERLYQTLQAKGFVVVSVGVDDEIPALKEFKEKQGLTFPVLHDKVGVSRKKYKITGYPETFFLNQEGVIQMLPDPDDGVPVVRVVGPREWHSTRVVKMLEQLLR
ncbi:TlpA family protein disulfide reductase [Oligoflexia bacterium]|nr:TlpA family protein disulfide reductase [Oligoflexia bacterium]